MQMIVKMELYDVQSSYIPGSEKKGELSYNFMLLVEYFCKC